MSLDQLKLTKQVISAMTDAGFNEAKEIQIKSLSRIIGGQDIVAVGPEGCGKSTLLVMAVLTRLKYAQDPPRALILVPNKEKGLELTEQFNLLGKYSDLRVLGLYPGGGMEGQKDSLAEGTDIVIGTPDRIHAIYLKSGLNLNKVNMFILDDAEAIVKQGFQTLVHQISDRLPKCQHLIFSEVIHSKLNQLGNYFLNFPTVIEVNELPSEKIEVIDQGLYQVPNFKTKVNLLKALLENSEEYSRTTIFVNTRFTAENIYKQLTLLFKGEVAILTENNLGYISNCHSINEFAADEKLRILLIAGEENSSFQAQNIPVILFFDVPTKEQFLENCALNESDNNGRAVTFSTDLELSTVSKIEQAIGQKIARLELPQGLHIESDLKRDQEEEKKAETSEEERGSAFHKKKDSNAKEYNWKFKDRLKMFGKKNRENKRGEK